MIDGYGGRPLEPTPNGEWLDIRPAPFPPDDEAPRIEAMREILFAPQPLDDLEQLAWGTDEPAALSTYAIVDAAGLNILPELLETSDLPHRCLFTGKAAEDFRDSAPYLVELHPDATLTARLLAGEAANGLWDRNLGHFIRARGPMDAVWRHLRKFTRLRDHKGQWFFNRFWAPTVATTLMTLGNDRKLAPYLSPLFPEGRAALHLIVPTDTGAALLSRKPHTAPPKSAPILTPEVVGWMRHIRRVQEFDKLIPVAIERAAPQRAFDPIAATEHLRSLRDGYFGMGFWRRDHLVRFCVWELLLGPDFLHQYADGHIRDIILASDADWKAIDRISAFLNPPPPEPTGPEVAAMLAAGDAVDD